MGCLKVLYWSRSYSQCIWLHQLTFLTVSLSVASHLCWMTPRCTVVCPVRVLRILIQLPVPYSVMAENLLKLNPYETEFVLFGSRTQRGKFFFSSPPTQSYGWVTLPHRCGDKPWCLFRGQIITPDMCLQLLVHVFLSHWRSVPYIKRYIIDKSALLFLANNLVGSCLDYCNPLFQTVINWRRPSGVDHCSTGPHFLTAGVGSNLGLELH